LLKIKKTVIEGESDGAGRKGSGAKPLQRFSKRENVGAQGS
jgi:hypothetical protein